MDKIDSLHERTMNSSDVSIVTEIKKDTRDKIAEVIDSRYKEHLLAPTVEGFVYGTTRALDFGDYWGTVGKMFGNNQSEWEWAVNRNADLFNYDELIEEDEQGIPRYLSFRNAAMHVNHNSHDPKLAIGLVFDATLVMDKYGDTNVTILFGIDRLKAASIVRSLETYPNRVFTSMGCSIKSSICTVCGTQILKDSEMCTCLRMHRGARLRGRKVAELLQKMMFYEQSIVTTPACPNARVIDAISEILPGRILKVAKENLNDADVRLRIMNDIYQSIRVAKSFSEKKRLSNMLDELIYKLEQML